MPAGGRRSPGDPALAGLVSLLVLGLLYGAAEFARQAWWKPSPPGIPGDSGGDGLAHLALGVAAVAVPGALAWFLLRRLPDWLSRVRWWLTAIAALLPTALLVLDRAAEQLHWDWTGVDVGGLTYYLRLSGLGLAAVLVPALLFAWKRPGRRAPRVLSGLALLLIVASPFVLAFGLRTAPVRTGVGPVAPPSAPCILLITVDTLRQDALAPYGGPVALPASLAQARVFDGRTVSSWTAPSMASLFTSLAPTGHGADKGRAPSTEVGWWPEVFQGAGWNTAAVVTNPFLRRRYGFDRGFAWYEHAEELGWLEPIARTFWAEWWQQRRVDRGEPDRADRRVARAQRWLEHRDPQRPWLLWLHLMDPHLPYHLRGPQGAASVDEAPDWLRPLEPVLEHDRFAALREAREGQVVNTPAQRGALQRLYHTEVDFAMHWVAELVESAQVAAGERELLWVLTSDHGEEFWDDGGFEHGHTLHDAVLRVPMLAGGTAASRLDLDDGSRLRLIDVGPMLAANLGPGPLDVRSASGLLEGSTLLDAYATGVVPAPGLATPLLAEGVLYGPPRTLLVAQDGVSLERRDDTGALVAGRRWGEATDAPDSVAIGGLRGLLIEVDLWRERNADRGVVVESDPDLERRLRAVGYLH